MTVLFEILLPNIRGKYRVSKYLDRFFTTILIMVFGFSFVISGCSKTTSISESLIEVDYSMVEDMMNKDETFILELALSNCYYCKEFESECLSVAAPDTVQYLKLTLDKIDIEIEKIETLLNISIDSVPMVIWIQDGMIEDEFPMDYPHNRKALFQDWITDNIAYFENER